MSASSNDFSLREIHLESIFSELDIGFEELTRAVSHGRSSLREAEKLLDQAFSENEKLQARVSLRANSVTEKELALAEEVRSLATELRQAQAKVAELESQRDRTQENFQKSEDERQLLAKDSDRIAEENQRLHQELRRMKEALFTQREAHLKEMAFAAEQARADVAAARDEKRASLAELERRHNEKIQELLAQKQEREKKLIQIAEAQKAELQDLLRREYQRHLLKHTQSLELQIERLNTLVRERDGRIVELMTVLREYRARAGGPVLG